MDNINIGFDNNFEAVVEFLKIINEPNRLRLLHLMGKNAQCVCDTAESLGLPQNLVSHHIKVLKDFGLLKSKKDGRKVIYHLNKRAIKEYVSMLNNFLIFNFNLYENRN